MSWQSDIEDIIGSVGDTGLITSSLRYIGSEVLNNLPDSRLKEVAQEKDITSGGLSIQSRRILAVHVNNYNAREGSVTNVAKYKDTPDFLDESVITYNHSEIKTEMEKNEWQ